MCIKLVTWNKSKIRVIQWLFEYNDVIFNLSHLNRFGDEIYLRDTKCLIFMSFVQVVPNEVRTVIFFA